MKDDEKSKGQLIKELTELRQRVAELEKSETARKRVEEARKQVEKEKLKAHRQLSDIIEFLPDATFVIDENKVVIAWNRAIEEMTGVRKEEVIGKGDYAYAVPFYGVARPILIDLTFLSDGEIESKYDYVKKEGDALVAETFIPSLYKGKGAFLWGSASRLYDPEGNVVGAIESIRDISTLKRAEKALSEEKERLDVTLRSIGDGVIVTDTKGTVTALNPVAEELTGWGNEEAAGRLLTEVFHIINEKTREVCEKPVEKVMEKGLVVGLANHTALIARDGTERMIADSGAPIQDKDGNIIGVVLVFRDVTEEKQAEDALRETRDHLENLISYANAPIIVWDPDSKISRFNHAFEHLTGYTASEVIGQELKMLFPEASRDESLNKIARTLSGEYWESVGIPILRKDGEVRIALWNSANIYAEDGKTLLATIAQGQDITERNRAEEALQESKGKFRLLSEQSLMGIIIVQDYVFKYANQALSDILEYSIEEMLNWKPKEYAKIIHPDDLAFVMEQARKKQLGEEDIVAHYEWRAVTKTGKVKWIEIYSKTISFEGETADLVTMIDITERKQAEEERERLLRELEAKTKELEQIVYVTSHDLRSPLVNVQGFSKELEQSIKELSAALQSADIPAAVKDEVSPILDENVPEALRYIHTSTTKMDLLLSGLLRLSRLGRAALTIEKLDMTKLMSEIAGAFEFQLKEKDAGLVIDTLPPCQGDKMQINQVFSNLLDNALKYLDPNRQGVIKISGELEDGQSVYCVEDNGVGIAPDHQAKIFEIFNQLDPSTSSGEGLGLAIVQKILERHNGKIWLESEPGKGSKFFVALPTDKPRNK